MKEKLKHPRLVKVAYVVGIIALILLVYGIGREVYLWNSEPEFTITKEECTNADSENIFVEINDFCKYIGEDYNPSSWEEYQKLISVCKNLFYDLVDSTDYLKIVQQKIVVHESGTISAGEEDFEFIIESKEVCEQVEVDSISLSGEWCDNNLCVCISGNNKTSCGSRIEKSDLSIEFLDENCECLFGSNCEESCGVCFEYKCGEKYFVSLGK